MHLEKLEQCGREIKKPLYQEEGEEVGVVRPDSWPYKGGLMGYVLDHPDLNHKKVTIHQTLPLVNYHLSHWTFIEMILIHHK